MSETSRLEQKEGRGGRLILGFGAASVLALGIAVHEIAQQVEKLMGTVAQAFVQSGMRMAPEMKNALARGARRGMDDFYRAQDAEGAVLSPGIDEVLGGINGAVQKLEGGE